MTTDLSAMARLDGRVLTTLLLLACVVARATGDVTNSTARLGVNAPTGERGPPGVEGVQGPAGDRGTDDYPGMKGPTGATGHGGPPGDEGEEGLQGRVGSTGATGREGTASLSRGPSGDVGQPGERGHTGATGATGGTGPVGAIGTEGARGVGGKAGVIGEDGPRSATGPTGPTGFTGPAGPRGPVGEIGEQGEEGDGGAVGETGSRGPPGFILADADQCALGEALCQQTCANRREGYECGCHSGYTLLADRRNCTDDDECLTWNGGCDQVCKNTPGSFLCSCTAGYTLSLDQRTCIDVNECLINAPPKCNVTETCINSLGGYSCLHKSRVYMPRERIKAAAQRRADVFLNRRVFIGLLTWLAVLTLITLVCLFLFWFADDDDHVTSAMRRDYIADRKFHWRHTYNQRYVFPRLSTNVSAKREVESFNGNLVECQDKHLTTPTMGATPTPTPTGATTTPIPTENARL